MTSNELTLVITSDYYSYTRVPSVGGADADGQKKFSKEHNILKTSLVNGEFKLHFKDEESMVKYAMTML